MAKTKKKADLPVLEIDPERFNDNSHWSLWQPRYYLRVQRFHEDMQLPDGTLVRAGDYVCFNTVTEELAVASFEELHDNYRPVSQPPKGYL